MRIRDYAPPLVVTRRPLRTRYEIVAAVLSRLVLAAALIGLAVLAALSMVRNVSALDAQAAATAQRPVCTGPTHAAHCKN